MSDRIADSLNLVPLIPEIMIDEVGHTRLPEVVDPNESQAEEDFAQAPENIKQAADMGQKVLEDMAEFIQTAPSGKAFEVFSEILRAIGETNDRLIDIHRRRKELGSQKSKTITNNTLIVGSTKELQDLIREKTS